MTAIIIIIIITIIIIIINIIILWHYGYNMQNLSVVSELMYKDSPTPPFLPTGMKHDFKWN